MTEAYPLHWPDGWPRTAPHMREDGRDRFGRRTGAQKAWGRVKQPVTLSWARDGLIEELDRMGARHIVISSDLRLRLDGIPASNQRRPEDPGVAVYFALKGQAMVMARDAFERIEDNPRSLGLAVEGLRQVQRHGGGAMLERAFAGFTALPPPEAMSVIHAPPPARPWWEVLGVAADAPWAVVKGAYRGLVMEAGGASAEITAAWAQAREARSQ